MLLASIASQTDGKRYAEVFADVRADDWFAGAVGVLANLRVISGKADGIFAPADLLTRGEAVALLYRLLFEERQIEELEGDTVTINGYTYRYADDLASLFWEANRNALVGSVIQFVNEGDTIVAVTGLEIRGSDVDSEEPVIFDGGGGVIAGNLYVSAHHAIITDIHIKRNLIIRPSSQKAILLHGSVVEGHTILMPIADSTNDQSFIFMYADVAFVEGVLLARDADVVNLAELILAGVTREDLKPYALRGKEKSDRRVTIAALDPYFNVEWYFKNHPDIYLAGVTTMDAWWQFYVNDDGASNGHSPTAWFDANDYLNAKYDTALGNEAGFSSVNEHFLQHSNSASGAPMMFFDLQTYFSENSDELEALNNGLMSTEEEESSENGENGGDEATQEPGFSGLDLDLSNLLKNHMLSSYQTTLPQRFSLHFVSSSVVNIGRNTELDIIVAGNDSMNVTVNGDAEQLAIRVASPESGQSTIVIEINGQVEEISLSGEFDGEIVFTGSGKIGAIETEGDQSGTPSIRFEGDLEVGTVNDRPAKEPEPAGSPADDSGSGSGSVSLPIYHPSVTAAVYTAFAHHAAFEIETADAVKVYYAALYPESEKPDAQTLKNGATSTEGGAGGMKGEASVSAGRASFTVTQLAEAEPFVLYAVAEAPDGTLSKVYMQPFATDKVKIVDIHYSPGEELTLFVKLNTIKPTSVYWLLTDQPDDGYMIPVNVREMAVQGCDETSSTSCRENLNMTGTDTAVIILESVKTGLYYLYATAEGKQLSPVFRLEVQAD